MPGDCWEFFAGDTSCPKFPFRSIHLGLVPDECYFEVVSTGGSLLEEKNLYSILKGRDERLFLKFL